MVSRKIASISLLTILVAGCGSESSSSDLDASAGAAGQGAGGISGGGQTGSHAGATGIAGTSTLGVGGSLVGAGGVTVGAGGANVGGAGLGGTNVGGAGVGGATATAGNAAAAAAGGATGETTCISGVRTGDACNPAIDTTECVRTNRTCTCGTDSTWTCASTADSGGSTGAGGTPTGSGGKSPGFGGVTGSGGITASSGGSGLGGATGTGGSADTCEPYSWPGYTPNLDYKYEGATVDPSTLTLYQGCDSSVVKGSITSGWWSAVWGNNRNSEITDAQIQTVLDGLNEDIGYIRDSMGWPPGLLAQDGYLNAVYIHGSGLCTDDEQDNTATGGWQSWVGSYPMVDLTWAPIVNYDRGGITHEAIHAMVKGTAGGLIKAAWYNEGGNTFIQMQLGAQRDGTYGVGWLDGGPYVAPHQPIECYSGWLLDGTFGGPDAEGVHSNYRTYLGGHQYSAAFPIFLSMYLSPGANAWVWNETEHSHVLETLASGLGESQVRHLIMEYRTRNALVDYGPWRDSLIETAIDYSWGQTLNADTGCSPQAEDYLSSSYAPTTTSGTTITPDDYTLPGWSGSNQIPLEVSGNKVRLNFTPTGNGNSTNMRVQLAYWAEDGQAVYSQPVSSGEVCLSLDKTPKNNVVIAVVTNTDYLYVDDTTRSTKFGYMLDMVEGVISTADRTTQWFEK